MNLSLDTAPADDEILALCSVADIKSNLRISNTAEDDFISSSILEAFDWLAGEQGWLNRSVLTSTWTLRLPGFKKPVADNDRDGRPIIRWVPTKVIELPKPPLIQVNSVKYLVDDVLTTLATTEYNVVTNDIYGRVELAYAKSWPADIDIHPESVVIEFDAGYGDGATTRAAHPALLRAMKLLASDYFRNREDTYAEPRLVAVNRKVINGLTRTAGRYRLPNRHA